MWPRCSVSARTTSTRVSKDAVFIAPGIIMGAMMPRLRRPAMMEYVCHRPRARSQRLALFVALSLQRALARDLRRFRQ
jgi:hypothetical protein